MARTHARILTSIWAEDSDFLQLTVEQQWTFFALLSQRNLSTCGVLSWQPKRLVHLAPGLTAGRIRKAADILHTKGYVVIDTDTDELAFRTFLRNDGILKSPNLLKAAARSYEGIYSPAIRRVVLDQLPEGIRRLWPTAILTTDPKTIGAILSAAHGSTLPLNPSADPSANPLGNARSTSLSPVPYPLFPVPAPPAEGSRHNGSTANQPAAAAAEPREPSERGTPPPELLARFGRSPAEPDPLGPDGWGDPEATGPDETEDDRNRRRSMAVRLADVIGPSTSLIAANRAVAEALGLAAWHVVDEQIGWLAQADKPPRTPGAILAAVRRMTTP